ncbi:MAG TPA: ribosome silencing factor [Pyrinomonadaceae bacterium]|jgi:ribosome-associated protein
MEQTLKEKSLQHEGTAAAAAEAQAEPADVLDERLIGALRAASDKKAVNSLVLDLREVTEFTDFFIITNGTNVRQVQAIADGISEDLKLIDARPIRIEGYNTAEWILMDYGDFVVHIFEEKSREFFDLERLWRDAKRVQIPENL